MITYLVYRLGIIAIKKTIEEMTPKEYMDKLDSYKPGNVSIGKAIKYSTNIILFLI